MNPMIYYLCPEPRNPSGGVRKIYRHVDILNQHGIAARVLHAQRDYRCPWFENTTLISNVDDVCQRDIRCLVIPEISGPKLHEHITLRLPLHRYLPWRSAHRWDVRGVAKVVFNQSAYLTFRGYDVKAHMQPGPYDDPSVKAVITVSRDSEQKLVELFPHIPIFCVRNSIDPHLFTATTKKRMIAYMPRRAEKVAKHVRHSLLSYVGMHDFTMNAISGVHETKVATRLGEAMLYLSLTQEEGFGLPAAEAMASGCLVIGFPAGGGKEFFNEDYCMPVADGDVEALCKTVKIAIARAITEPQWIAHMGQKASAAIHARYSPQLEESDVLRTWHKILPLLA